MIYKPVDVLVIEDDQDLCFLMETMLKFAGFTTASCNTPLSIDDKLRSAAPKAILMDMLLSGVDGKDICRMIKASPETKDKKIVMTSAHPDAEILCKEAGADDFLAKPFEMDDLIKKVTDILKANS